MIINNVKKVFALYQKRFYRDNLKSDNLVYYNVTIKETDLYIGSNPELLEKAKKLVLKYRNQIEDYIGSNNEFLYSLEPIKARKDTKEIIRYMCEAAEIAAVGPMAAVAGAISHMVGNELIKFSNEIIIENGGDIFIKTNRTRIVGLYAGENSRFNNLGIKLYPCNYPIGICTSAGSIGHSISFGNTDATVVLSESTFIADAMATSIGNMVKSEMDIEKAIEYAKSVDSIIGIIIIIGDKLGIWGDVELVAIENN